MAAISGKIETGGYGDNSDPLQVLIQLKEALAIHKLHLVKMYPNAEEVKFGKGKDVRYILSQSSIAIPQYLTLNG